MNGKPGVVDEQQSLTFDRFLLSSTGKVLNALESMFEFDIEKSESLIEVAPLPHSRSLRGIGDGLLYTVASELLGDLRGNAQIVIRAGDLDHLAEMLKPIMGLMFLSCPDTDLLELDRSRPRWMEEPEVPPMEDPEFQAQMMDALAELGNVLVGVYSRAIYEISACRTMHSLPQVTRNTDVGTIRCALDESCASEQQCLVIDNQFIIGGRLIHLWCVISLQPDSFQELLRGMDAAAVPPQVVDDRRPIAKAANA